MNFEIVNETLCRMVEPEPLTENAQFPCVVRLIQDDSPMGRYNKAYSVVKYGVRLGCCMLPLIATHIAKNGVVNDIEWDVSRYEIIGYPVADGSAEWALYHMMQGDIVIGAYWGDDVIVTSTSSGWHEVIGVGLYGKRHGIPITDNDFLFHAEKMGWQIYEPKPTYKVGDWVEFRDIEGIKHGVVDGIYDEYSVNYGGTSQSVSEKYITRKLDSSEVRVKLTLEGTVTNITNNTESFLMWHGENPDKHAEIIRYADIDPATRNLVEGLLKAQEEAAIVWYPYPDEKPTTRTQYLCYRDGFVRIFQWLDIYAQFDVNPTGNPLLTGNQPQWWAELPTPPEVINE